MKRILPCLAILAIGAFGSPAWSQPYDPIGDVITAVTQGAVENASDWSLRATLYHGGGRMSSRDSLGCRVSAMRTVAVDPSIVSRRTIIFIKETVGLELPDGSVHDGYWYASDIGPAIHGARIDLFTGSGAGSMRPLMPLNLKTLTVSKVGEFTGCPPLDGGASPTLASQNAGRIDHISPSAAATVTASTITATSAPLAAAGAVAPNKTLALASEPSS